MEKTLWELAQEWPHENELVTNFIEGRTSKEAVHLPSCRRCQLEQWAREIAKGITGTCESANGNVTGYLFGQDVLAMLGVPEEKP